VLAEIAENKGTNITKENLVKILNKYFKPTEITAIPDEIPSTSSIELKTTDDRYTVNLSEIYIGKFSKKERINLKAGDYVSYNGESRVVALDENDKFYLLSGIVNSDTLDTYSDIIDSSEYLNWANFNKIVEQLNLERTRINSTNSIWFNDLHNVILEVNESFQLNTIWSEAGGDLATSYPQCYTYVDKRRSNSETELHICSDGLNILKKVKFFSQLKDNVKILSGEGTKVNPYILALN